MAEAEDKRPDAGRATHDKNGAPKDEAHREAGDGTLQGSVPAGGLAHADDASESVEPGSG